jgi:hypothetical protein
MIFLLFFLNMFQVVYYVLLSVTLFSSFKKIVINFSNAIIEVYSSSHDKL